MSRAVCARFLKASSFTYAQRRVPHSRSQKCLSMLYTRAGHRPAQSPSPVMDVHRAEIFTERLEKYPLFSKRLPDIYQILANYWKTVWKNSREGGIFSNCFRNVSIWASPSVRVLFLLSAPFAPAVMVNCGGCNGWGGDLPPPQLVAHNRSSNHHRARHENVRSSDLAVAGTKRLSQEKIWFDFIHWLFGQKQEFFLARNYLNS